MKKVMNIKVIGYGLMVMGALLLSAPATAQNAQEWQSTSVMQTSGSTYSPQMTEIGATTASEMATTTTDTYSPANGPRRAKSDYGDLFDYGADTGQSTQSPVGEPWILAAFALAFGGVVAFRRRREA